MKYIDLKMEQFKVWSISSRNYESSLNNIIDFILNNPSIYFYYLMINIWIFYLLLIKKYYFEEIYL